MRNLLHKNIGPEVFCFGTGYKSYQLMMTNFQHATPYKDNFSKNHIPYCEDLTVSQYNQFTSVNVLSGLGSLLRLDQNTAGETTWKRSDTCFCTS